MKFLFAFTGIFQLGESSWAFSGFGGFAFWKATDLGRISADHPAAVTQDPRQMSQFYETRELEMY